jgi:tape measure domain-containing protein
MATVDDKVVAMSFEHSKFESGVDAVLSAIEKLKKALTFPNAGKGLQDLDAAGKKVDLGHIAKAVDDIKGKFSALSVAALAVFANIATKAVSAGAQLVKSLTLGPIIQGFHEYELKLGSIQTILSNTASAGTNLKDVNKALNDLNTYSDKTIYNFGQMTRNIGTFTAAGVDLDTAVGSIKGIANLAALSGSNAEQASTAMYQLSQAISAGRVSLQDWNSVVNAGMGGTIFQRALAQTAEHIGTLDKGAVKLKGSMKNVTIQGKSFRESIQAQAGDKPWLTSEVLTKTLEQLSGNLSDAQLKAQGYSDAQIKAIQLQAKQAVEAATHVKTLSQLLDTTKEAIGSGWAQTWEIIFGDFGEATKLFTGLSNVINGFVGTSSNARNKVLKDWKDLGGRTLLLDTIKKAFQALMAVITPIKDAFRDIFPAKTGKDLFNLTKQIHDFVETLKPSPETVDGLRRTFRGLFAVLDIGKQVIGGVFTVIGHLFSAISGGSGGFLKLTGNIGDFLVSIDNALKKGGKLHAFFDGLGTILEKPIELIGILAGAIADLFSTKSSGGVSGAIGGIGGSLGPLQTIVENLHTAWTNLMDALSGSTDTWVKVGKSINTFFSGLGTMIGDAISGINWDTVLAGINTGLFAALVLMFKKFFGKGTFADQFGGGILKSISGTFKALEGSMVSLQQNIKAKTLKEIAIAVGILAASLFVLSLIDPKKMSSAITGMTIAFGELIGAMALLEKVTMTGGFIKMPIIAAGLIGLSVAIGILTLAVRNLSGLSWEELAKGLGGVAVLLTALSIASGPLSRNAAGMITAGIGIAAIAVAMKILASAIKDFGSLSWTALAKGMLSVAAALVIIGGAARLFPPNMVVIGAGLIAVGVSLKLIASAVQSFSGMNWSQLGKGIGALAASLLIIAGAMQLMPPGMVLQAAGLLLVAAAITVISNALQAMGGMSVSAIAKSLITLAGALLILGAALIFMEGSIAGAAALAVAAAGIALLAPALKTLGSMGWVGIIKSMVALAAALTLLAVASIAVTPVIPEMLALGVALVAIGAGLALAGAGIALMGVGLSAIAASGSVAIGVLLDALTKFVNAIPAFSRNFILGLLSVVNALAATAPQFVAAIIKIIDALLVAIIESAPKIATAFTALLDAAIKVLHDNSPKIIQAGFDLIIALLTGLRNNLPAIVRMVTSIITTFLTSMSGQANKIVSAGANFIVSIIRGISNNLNRIVTEAVHLVTSFITALANNYGKIVTAGFDAIGKFATGIGNNISKVVTAGANAIISLVTGLGKNAGKIVAAAVTAIGKFIGEVGRQGVNLANAAGQAILDFLNGLRKAVDKYTPEITQAVIGIGLAIPAGIVKGLIRAAGDVYRQIEHIASEAKHRFISAIKPGSPSKVYTELGASISEGLAKGIGDGADEVVQSAVAMSNGIINGVKNTFQITSPSKVMHEIGQYVGEGFVEGLKGSVSDIQSVTDELNSKLQDAIQGFRTTIETHEANIKELRREHHKGYKDAIDKQEAIIKQNENNLALATQTQRQLNVALKDTRKELLQTSKAYDDISQKLADAQQKLDTLRGEREQARKDFISQYTDTPAIDSESVDKLIVYQSQLATQIDATAKYSDTLAQLRGLGLDDMTYQKLLREGTADQEFASQLLKGGEAAVQGLNALDAHLNAEASKLGDAASHTLFDAGVKMQQDVVNGLTSDQSKIKADMVRLANTIADTLIKSLKKRFKSKSPSEVTKEIGADVIEGLAVGLTDSTKVVEDAADQVGSAAIDAMKKSMSGVSDALSAELAQPTITPILDLTQVQQDAQRMQSLLDANAIAARASYQQASSISASQAAVDIDSTVPPGGTSIKFEQNNYSPEALSSIEIYRQTRNQLAQAQLAVP